MQPRTQSHAWVGVRAERGVRAVSAAAKARTGQGCTAGGRPQARPPNLRGPPLGSRAERRDGRCCAEVALLCRGTAAAAAAAVAWRGAAGARSGNVLPHRQRRPRRRCPCACPRAPALTTQPTKPRVKTPAAADKVSARARGKAPTKGKARTAGARVRTLTFGMVLWWTSRSTPTPANTPIQGHPRDRPREFEPTSDVWRPLLPTHAPGSTHVL